jgi:hypothetical protein
VFGKHDWPTVKQALGDPRVDALAGRVHVDGIANWGSSDGEITVWLRDGRVISRNAEDYPAGELWLGWDEAVPKFRAMTNGLVPGDQVAEIVAEIQDLEQRASVAGVVRAFGATAAEDLSGARRSGPASRDEL